MIREIKEPQNGWVVTRLGAVVLALAKAINALRKLRFQESNRWHFSWEEGGAVIEYVPTASVGVLRLDEMFRERPI